MPPLSLSENVEDWLTKKKKKNLPAKVTNFYGELSFISFYT